MFLVAVVNAANVDVANVWIDGVVGVGGAGEVGEVGVVGVNGVGFGGVGVGQDGHFGAGHDGVIVGHTKESGRICCWVVCGKLKLIKVMKLSEVENNKRHRFQRDTD